MRKEVALETGFEGWLKFHPEDLLGLLFCGKGRMGAQV